MTPPRLERPRSILAAAAIALVVLGVIGLEVNSHLRPTSLSIAGTSSASGEALSRRYFGSSAPFAVLLRGPAAAIDRQGPGLATVLERQGAATVLSPWDAAPLRALRLGPRKALLLVDFHQPLDAAIRTTVPRLESVLEAKVRPPVTATQSGFASISRALQQESLAASERAELIAAPFLILILLLVFRSVVAALLPLLFGGAVVFAGRGVLVLLASSMRIDALSLVVCTMMGLALGVDYSLLIVSRFREELAAGLEPSQAAWRTRRSAGRTTIFAGSTLFLSLLVAAFLSPGPLLVSLAAALLVVAGLSVAIAWGVLPALLVLLGGRINAGGLRLPSRQRWPTVAAVAGAVLRRPALASVLILLPLMALATPALAFNTGAPGVDELPAGSPARKNAETIAKAAGPGWEAPFTLIAAAPRGPVTSRRRLASLALWNRRIAGQPGIEAVIGPAPIERATRPLGRLGGRLDPAGANGPDRLVRLGSRLRDSVRGVRRLRAGLASSSAGGGLLRAGSGRARAGADAIASSLFRASKEGGVAAGGLSRLSRGAGRLASAQGEALAAGFTLHLGMRSTLGTVRGPGLHRARRLAAILGVAARDEPALEPRAEEAAILTRVLASTQEELGRLRQLAGVLDRGLQRAAAGGRRLREGARRLAEGAGGAESGLKRLGAGAERLGGGLAGLEGGAASLEGGLSTGFHRSYPLQAGLGRAARQVSVSAGALSRESRALRRSSPRIFESGYFVLSALDGTRARRRSLAEEAIDLEQGGRAARMLIVPSAGYNSSRSRRTQELLGDDAQRLGRAAGLDTGVGGGAAVLNDYGATTKAALPLILGSIVLVTFLLLIVVLRAPLLAGLAVALNLISVAAALGAVSLLCRVPAGYPLGGHSYIDTVGGAAIFGVTFGLSIDYAVFLIARIRERRGQGFDNAAAISFGLERTAGLITGAAAIMAVVFVAFAGAPVATVSQMGAGLTVAVLLDATVVRIILLPALMLLLGERVWQVPGWLDRVLPQLSIEADEPGGIGATS